LLFLCLGLCLFATAQYHQRTNTRPRTSALAPRPEDRVDINKATLDELLKIPGMTRVWAARIVRFRPYRSKQNLVGQGILSHEAYARIKDYVIVHRDK